MPTQVKGDLKGKESVCVCVGGVAYKISACSSVTASHPKRAIHVYVSTS